MWRKKLRGLNHVDAWTVFKQGRSSHDIAPVMTLVMHKYLILVPHWKKKNRQKNMSIQVEHLLPCACFARDITSVTQWASTLVTGEHKFLKVRQFRMTHWVLTLWTLISTNVSTYIRTEVNPCGFIGTSRHLHTQPQHWQTTDFSVWKINLTYYSVSEHDRNSTLCSHSHRSSNMFVRNTSGQKECATYFLWHPNNEFPPQQCFWLLWPQRFVLCPKACYPFEKKINTVYWNGLVNAYFCWHLTLMAWIYWVCDDNWYCI